MNFVSILIENSRREKYGEIIYSIMVDVTQSDRHRPSFDQLNKRVKDVRGEEERRPIWTDNRRRRKFELVAISLATT